MTDESKRAGRENETQTIVESDPDVTIPIHVTDHPADGEKKSFTDTKTAPLPSHDFAVTLHTTSRILNVLIGKKRRDVDAEIESSGKDHASAQPHWDGKQEALGILSDIYDKRDEFAGGGQGVLSYAYDRSLHRTVALKSLRKEHLENHSSREDFLREARITATLDHPAIVPVYHLSGDEEHGLHLAMKVLHGISLKKYLEQICIRYQTEGIANFDEKESLLHRLDVFLQVCDAMAYVHSKNVIHGDLKPENIMIGEYHECYVMDWGTARPSDGGALPADARIVGTPRYIAPELLRGGPDGIQTDVYSLGVILFELVTLRAAFSGEKTADVLANVKNGAFNPLRHRFKAPIARDLAAIIRKAVSMDLRHRYRTVAELAEDIRRFLRGQEVSANPDGAAGKLVRWAGHHNKMILLIMVLLAFTSIAAATIGILKTAAEKAERERLLTGAEQYAFAKVRQNVVAMQMLLNRVAGELEMLNSDAALLLSLPRLPGSGVSPEFCPADKVRAICREKGNCFSPDDNSPAFFSYGVPLYFGGVSYITPGRSDRPEIQQDLMQLAPIIPRLKRTVLDCSVELPVTASDAERLAAYQEGKMPILYAYFSLAKNGLHLNYPAKPDYSTGYDPRTRPWYKNALKKGGNLVWSAPYHATGSMRMLMITASMELLDGKKQSYGVAGVDLPLAVFSQFMTQNPQAASYTMQRMLVDETGRIVLQADSDGRSIEMHPLEEEANGVSASKPFPDGKLLQQIRRKMYGGVSVRENGRTVFYAFSGIPVLHWFYVEKLDWEKLLRYPHLTY